jgi:hypothetical protein
MYYYEAYIKSSLYYGIETAKLNKDLTYKIHKTESNIIKNIFGLSKHTSSAPLRNALGICSTLKNIKTIKAKFILRASNNDYYSLYYSLILSLCLFLFYTLRLKNISLYKLYSSYSAVFDIWCLWEAVWTLHAL